LIKHTKQDINDSIYYGDLRYGSFKPCLKDEIWVVTNTGVDKITNELYFVVVTINEIIISGLGVKQKDLIAATTPIGTVEAKQKHKSLIPLLLESVITQRKAPT
jgi:hypothetical protein